MSYPIQVAITEPERFSRSQLLIRFAALFVLARLRLSIGSLLALAYVALPVYAAIRTASLGASENYLRTDGQRLIRALNWAVAVTAWAAFASERIPAKSPDETVVLTVDGPPPRFSTGAVLLRIVTGLPSALVLMVIGCLGGLVWLWAAISILFTQRVGHATWGYLVGMQRWTARLLAYQAGLVDGYPPFSFDDEASSPPKARPLTS